MCSKQKAQPDAQADNSRAGCCSSAAKVAVINGPDIDQIEIEKAGCCGSANDNNGPDDVAVAAADVKGSGCCSSITKAVIDNGGQGEKGGCCSKGVMDSTNDRALMENELDGCCSPKVNPNGAEMNVKTGGCRSLATKTTANDGGQGKQDGCCSKKAANPIHDLTPMETKLDDCCSPKANSDSVKAHTRCDKAAPGAVQEESLKGSAEKVDHAVRVADVVPPCCEGIESNCCNDTCLEELAVRECDKDGCIETPTETSSATGFTRRRGTACDQHVKSTRQRWANKLETLGCLCRSLLAMNQKSCCTSRKQRPTGSVNVSRKSSASSLKITGTNKGPKFMTTNTSVVTSQESCCSDTAKFFGLVEKAGYDEALVMSPDRKKTRNTGCCADKITLPVVTADVDVEKGNTGIEHVAIGISGMTCTGCERKLKRTLDTLSSISKLKTSLVLGRADFDLDSAVMSTADVIHHLERTTEFKCTELTTQGSEIYVLPDGELKTFLQQTWPAGVTSMEKANKRSVRICFDARVIGARHLLQALQPSARLAPYNGDDSLSAGNKHVRNVGLMTLLSAALTIPVLVLAWAPPPHKPIVCGSVSLALASVVQIVVAGPFYPNAIKALVFSRIVEMDLLIVLSTSAAYIFSVVSFVYIVLNRPLSTGEFFETSTLLVTLIMVGHYVSALARQKAIESVAMRSLQTTKAVLVTENPVAESEIDARLLHYDDVFKVMPDSRIVTDGVVVSGVSEMDESMITGESKPVKKSAGSTVIAGSVNSFGTMLVRAIRLPGKNTISAIADMVDEAKLSKPKLQDIADKIASYFVPVIIGLSIVTFSIWVAVGITIRGQSATEATVQAITYAITVLIVSCPCAIGLAVPMVVVIANGIAAERGVFGSRVTHVVFDKTGTLTTGEPAVVVQEIILGDSATVQSQLLGVTTGIKHPVAVAVTSYLATQDVVAAEVTDVKSIAGKGIEAILDGDITIRVGNSRWLGVETHPQVQNLLSQGYTVFCVEIGHSLSAVFGLRDQPRPEAASVVKKLQERGISVSIVSGDDKNAVATTAFLLGVSTFHAQCSPASKRDFMQSITDIPEGSKRKPITLFIGDGANDGPALAQATIGVHIAPSSSTSDIASDAARAAADAVLLRPSLEGLLVLTAVSKAAVKRIVFNFVWSFVYNLFVILLAGGAFVNVRIPPQFAGLGEVVSVVPVVVVAVMMEWVKFEV
ncbi:heavy metal translocatin [Aureobasidium subglaciale]|nr:heavy metal translocatin [Aureobasidium subglaciale]